MPSDTKNHSDLDEKKMRLKRLESIKKSGVNPYPEKFEKINSLTQSKAAKEGAKVKTAGDRKSVV